MATLTRLKPSVRNPFLDSEIPKPFPREQLAEETPDVQTTEVAQLSESSTSDTVALKDVMPSILHVQKSCLMTLNNLLSEPQHWQPILPNRRHSMPSSPVEAEASTSLPQANSSTTSALRTLVTNMRNHESGEGMIEVKEARTDSELLSELRHRVEKISASLPEGDASLANALVSLLSDLNRLSDIQANITYLPQDTLDKETSSILEAPPPMNIFDTLTRQLSDLQIERLSSQAGILAPGSSSLLAVETALLWSRIDSELDNVVAMCKERTEFLPKFTQDHLPPQYDLADYDDSIESPPDYENGGRTSFDDSKSKVGYQQSMRQGDEKMRMDLEAVTMAIDRLYLVAPQLHSQRVELNSTKLAQMQQASREGPESQKTLKRASKGKDRDIKELEKLVDMIGKASERTMKDQSVVLDGGMQAKLLERSRKREIVKREAFVEQLIKHSDAGRMHGQDAVRVPRVRDPEALLTLPEFMRESLPPSERTRDPKALLSLPEFVKEAMPPYVYQSDLDVDLPKVSQSELDAEYDVELPEMTASKPKKKRHRSLSAPPLAWLRSTSSRGSSSSGGSVSAAPSKGKFKLSRSNGFDVIYVAENHENLHHTLVFLTLTGVKSGADVQAEILRPFSDPTYAEAGEYLTVKSGPHCSLPLMLPAHTSAGPKEVRVQSSHYEIKLVTESSSASSTPPDSNDPVPLLDASQLSSINPTSYLCASCSLPVIQSTKVNEYRDLPSEHWEELVEAWMCHGDQKVTEQIQKHGKTGFWPTQGQGLVGGSYILFDESTMNKNNLHVAKESRHNDNWRLARCICGAIVGRCQERASDASNATVYRILKYAVRPVSATSEPVKIPLSAFIVEDMTEFVQAHASYRFVIQDEEEEKARILIWLFKPRIRLAYATPKSHAISKSGNIVAAKVLYKLIKPGGGDDDIKSVLNRYPGFPQAEYLSYPMAICRRLAGMLKESNSAYPESLRMMTGLEVGWLQRV